MSSGLIDPKHLRRMGCSLRVFLWCVDHQTDPEGGVLYGKPVKVSRIARDIGISLRVAQKDVARLARQGYIKLQRSARGLLIAIVNQKKWPMRETNRSFARETNKTFASETNKVADHVKNGRARDLHLKSATERSTGRDLSLVAQSHGAPALSVRPVEKPTTGPLAYYSAEDLALMPPAERALVERLTASDYDALAAGDCVRCETGPRVVGKLCLDCAPKLVLAPRGGTA